MKKSIVLFVLFAFLCTFTAYATEISFDALCSVSGEDLTIVLTNDTENLGMVNIYVMKPSNELSASTIEGGLYNIKQANMTGTSQTVSLKFGGQDPSGEYTVYAVSKNGEAIKKVSYLNEVDNLTKILVDIKNIADSASVISANHALLGLSAEDTEIFNAFTETQKSRFNTLIKLGGSISTKAEFITVFVEASMISDIDTAPYTQLEGKLRGYSQLNIDFSEYNALSYSAKTNALKAVSEQTLSTPSEIKTTFKNAVDANKTIVSGGGGSGGGGGGSTVTVSPDYVAPPITQQPTTQEIFNDLQNAQWAKESIEYLYNKGIVNGKGDGKFDPNGNVTREEFVKMLMGALNLGNTKPNTSAYKDVHPKAWYAGYVEVATSLGIVKGNNTGEFGIGNNILRQDMAIMCYRALEGAKISIPTYTNNITFADVDTIDEYATEGVIIMAKSNILSGKGNGRFAPKEIATRAEAAKIIYEIMKLAV